MCATFNFAKRNQSADLSGMVAIVTGGRVRIGFEIVLKLLRAGGVRDTPQRSRSHVAAVTTVLQRLRWQARLC